MADDNPAKILDIPNEHLPYLEEAVYPTLLTAMEKLLQRIEDRPNDELNPINWLATYLHTNNPNNNLMRKVDDLASDLRARRSRVKQEATEAHQKKKTQEWREFAVSMASMRAQERVRKTVPTLLTKALQPQVQREVFYQHTIKNARRKMTGDFFEAAANAAVGGGNVEDYLTAEDEKKDDGGDSSDEGEQASALDLVHKCMNHCVVKQRGQKPLFSVFFEFLKMQYQTNFAFIALREGSPNKECLRIVASFTGDTGSDLTNVILHKEDRDSGDELLWECLFSGEAKVVEDGSILSIVDNEMCVPFLLAAAAAPKSKSDDDAKQHTIAVIGVALPQLAIAEGEGEGESEGIAKSSAKDRSTIGEEEDEDEVKRRECIESVKAGAAALGLSLVQTWRNLDEPRIHRLQLATSKLIDECVNNTHLSAQGVKQLARMIAAHTAHELSTEMAPVTVLIGTLDDTHDLMWLSGVEGAPVLPELPHYHAREDNPEDLIWKVRKSLEIEHVSKARHETVFGQLVSEEDGKERSVLVTPLVVPPDEDDEIEVTDSKSRGFCVGVLIFIRSAKDTLSNYNPHLDVCDIEQGFTRDERAIVDAVKATMARAVHAIHVREGFEHILQGLLRRYARKDEQAPLSAAGLQPHFHGPVMLQFRRQIGPEVVDATVHSSRLHPLHIQHASHSNTIKLDLGAGQPAMTLMFKEQSSGVPAQKMAEEIKEVAGLALSSVCNPNHRSFFEFQSKARITRRWLLASEALLRYQRLQLGRLTEEEVLQLEPRQEPDMANRGVITAVLMLLGEVPLPHVAIWKKCRKHLGAPMLLKVVEFDPTSSKVSQQSCRDAIRSYKQTVPYKNKMFPAAAALHDWLGAVFWVRKEMRVVSEVVSQTTVESLNNHIKKKDGERLRTIIEVDLFTGTGVDTEGNTPLHAALTLGDGDDSLMQLILSMDGAKSMVDTVDRGGKTPIHHVVDRGMLSMVHQLCNAGASLDALDVQGRTPLMCAIMKKDLGLVQLLLDSKANPNVVTSHGSAMNVATGWNDAQRMLQAYGGMTSGALGVKTKKTNGDDDEEDGYGPDDM